MATAKRRNFRATFTVATLVMVAIVVLLISVLSNMTGARVDMTSDKLFTLSPAAVKILKDLKVPVQVKLYITPADKMPTSYKTLERDIGEQLHNYERVSDGKLQFSVYNPQDNEDMQKELTSKGIRPFQVQSVDKDEIGLKLIWSAMTIAYKDHPAEVVPQILPETLPNLETMVIVPVYRLTRDKQPKVAVFAPKKEVDPQLAMMYLQQGMQPPQPEDQYKSIGQLLDQEHYESVKVDLTKDSPIPADADLLIVMAPVNLNERQAFAINRALSNGMPVLMAVQAHEYNYSPAPTGGWQISGRENKSGLEKVLGAFGLSVGTDHFLDANLQVLDLPREVNLGGLRMQTREPVKTPIQIKVTEDQMNPQEAITNRISQLLYLWGTPIDEDTAKLSQDNLQATTLMSSSDRCWTVPFNGGSLSTSDMDPRGKTMLGAQPLAVSVEGIFPDAYAGQDPPAWPAAKDANGDEASAPAADAPPTPLTPAPSRLVLVGCAKMFDDNIIQGGQNSLLLMNAIDAMGGSSALLSIRAKTLTERTIRPVSAGSKAMWRFATVALIPVLFAVFGFARMARRRREAVRYRRELTNHPNAGHGSVQ